MVLVPPGAEGRVSAAAERAGLGVDAGEIVLSGGKKALNALAIIVISVPLFAILVNGLWKDGIPDSATEWFGFIVCGLLGPAILYSGLEDLGRSLRDEARVYLFEHGLVAIDVRRRLRVFTWRTIRVNSEITELKQTSYARTPYYRSHVYTLTRPDGESLRLDSAMCKDVIALGPRIAAAANFEQGR